MRNYNDIMKEFNYEYHRILTQGNSTDWIKVTVKMLQPEIREYLLKRGSRLSEDKYYEMKRALLTCELILETI